MKDECYEFLKNETGKVNIVGFGSYGEVKLARNTENKQIVAIKMIYNKNAKEQIDVHHKLNHPSIIKLINYYYEKQKNTTYMVLEYASCGSLNEKIKFGYGQLSKQLVRKYFKDICQAVQYLHENNYMHRDIKPENILITKDNHAKLCDFGFASILEYRSTLCGTYQYMAPEMIQKKPYDYKIDIWALGILLFELIQGYAPFRGETGQEVITEMKKPLLFSTRFDTVEIDLIKKILRVNAENRLQISKILEHAYFKDDNLSQTKEVRQSTQSKGRDSKEIDINVKQQKTNKQLKEGVKTEKIEIVSRKEGQRKFDFLNRKGQNKAVDLILKPERKESIKQNKQQSKKQQSKKQEVKKQFKPYVPPNIANQKSNHIKNPIVKPVSSIGFAPITSQGFAQSSGHQLNTSMQTALNNAQGNSISSTPYQFSNSNASIQNQTKYLATNNPIVSTHQPSTSPTYNNANFSKPMNPGYFMQQRSPTQQHFPVRNIPQQLNGQQGIYQTWKKS